MLVDGERKESYAARVCPNLVFSCSHGGIPITSELEGDRVVLVQVYDPLDSLASRMREE